MSAINLTNAECAMLYQDAYDYLLNHTDGLTREILDAYLECKRLNSLDDVFFAVVNSINDWRKAKKGIIIYKANAPLNMNKILTIVKNCKLNQFLSSYAANPDALYDEFMKQLTFQPNRKSTQDVVLAYASSICSMAKYLSKFEDIEALYNFFDQFKTTDQKAALIDEVYNAVHTFHPECRTWGFALCANWLKDIGMSDYCKPDTHVKKFLLSIQIINSENNDIAAFKALVEMAEAARAIISYASAFRFDRLIYLIGSGDFYSHSGIVTYHGSMKEFVAQELAKILRGRAGNPMKKTNKFHGCLIGGAVGDALGYTVEFQNERTIFDKYGPDGITEYDLSRGIPEAIISDDTQMTLFTANGLLLDITENDVVSNIANCYKDWYQTQYVTSDAAKGQYAWLMHVPDLFNRRAPGHTCLSAIEHGANGTIECPINDSKGCGGVMRVAPVGLYFSGSDVSIEESDLIGARAAAITHGHELGYIPAAALAHIIRKVIEDDQITLKGAVQDSILAMNDLFPSAAHISDFVALMQKAVMLAASNTEDLDAIHELGEGWVAEETLAIAVFCVLRHEHDFGRAVIAAVNHKGDSDSTGAVTGNILGAYLGYDAIPERFRRNLELHDVIVEIADDLLEGRKPGDAAWRKKYIEHDYRR